jgi:phosphocarrier protein
MKEFKVKVLSPVGLHARPAAAFAAQAKSSGCTVKLSKIVDGTATPAVDGASVLRVMTLGVKCGDEIYVQVEGEGEEQVAAALQVIAESTED